MSGSLTIYGASQILTTYFTRVAEPPTSFFLALIANVAPTPYLDGSELDEPTAPDYARIEIPNDGFSWANDSAPQEVYNVFPIQFTTATTDWGQLRFWALCNALVDGYNIIVGELESPVQILTGDQASFAEGDLSASLGPFFLAEEE